MEKFEPTRRDLKYISVSSSLCYAKYYDVRCTGYLLRSDDPAQPNDVIPLVVSLIGPSSARHAIGKDLKSSSFTLPHPRYADCKTRDHYYRCSYFFKGEPDQKIGGMQVEVSEIPSSVWSQMVFFRKDLLEVSITPEGVIKGYVLGENLEDIKLGFPRFFRHASFPYLPEWQDLLVDEVFRRPDWSTKLLGFNMHGYALHIPQEEVLGFLQEKAKLGLLPYSAPVPSAPIAPKEIVEEEAIEFDQAVNA